MEIISLYELSSELKLSLRNLDQNPFRVGAHESCDSSKISPNTHMQRLILSMMIPVQKNNPTQWWVRVSFPILQPKTFTQKANKTVMIHKRHIVQHQAAVFNMNPPQCFRSESEVHSRIRACQGCEQIKRRSVIHEELWTEPDCRSCEATWWSRVWPCSTVCVHTGMKMKSDTV